MQKTGLILEGGGTRGVFTSGVLDFFMEQDFYLPYIIGVSFGCCNAVDYVSKQIGRTKECTIDYLYKDTYVGFRNFIKNRSLFDMDMIFDRFPNEIIPFDFDTYFASEGRCIIVATNCLTGEAIYFEEKEDKENLLKICRASSSLPFVSPMVYIDKVPYLDGGLSDSIPIRKALRDGYKKNIVILTRNKGYRKNEKSKKKYGLLTYKKFPNLNKEIYWRNIKYNKTLALVERLEKEGRIYVIRPQIDCVSRTESNPEKLTKFYNHGYQYAKEIFKEVQAYVNR